MGTDEQKGGLKQAWKQMRKATGRRAPRIDIGNSDAIPAQKANTKLVPESAQRRSISRASSYGGAVASSSQINRSTPNLPSSHPPVPLGVWIPDHGLEPDPEEEEGDDELPTSISAYRAGITNERARVLFARHGINFDPPASRGGGEPPKKLRRVQRPVHVAAAWICHECQTAFGNERTCPTCQHPRCPQCMRSRANRETDSSERAQDLPTSDAPAQSSLPQSSMVLLSADASEGPTLATVPTTALAQSLEPDDEDSGGDVETVLASIRQSVYSTRPDSRNREAPAPPVRKPAVQIVRRTCHECRTLISPGRPVCQKCGHVRCEQCPRDPPKPPPKWLRAGHETERVASMPATENAESIASDGASTSSALPAPQRVFRKARQRVRYTCDRCQAVILGRYTCQECGHQRCAECVRFPPRKSTTSQVLSVTDQLSACDGLGGRPQSSILSLSIDSAAAD